MSAWKKNKYNEHEAPPPDEESANFTIPTYEVLHSYPTVHAEGFTNKNNDMTNDIAKDTARNFVMFDDLSYFKNPTRVMQTPLLKGSVDLLVQFINFILCPVYKVDTLIDNQLEELVKMYVILDCTPERMKHDNRSSELDDVVDPSILWTDADEPLEIGVNRTTDNFQTMREGFNYTSNKDLLDNVNRFRDNHPWIKTDILKARLATYYLSELNRAENETGSYLTTPQLIDFNNEFDNSLENLEIIQKIRQTEVSDDMSLLFLTPPTLPPISIPTPPAPAPKKKMSKCDRVKQRAIDELNRSKKVIKSELYAILMIPVIAYITYNVFFMLFSFEPTETGGYTPTTSFKDLDVEWGFDPPVSTDDGSDLDETTLHTKYAMYAEELQRAAKTVAETSSNLSDDEVSEKINQAMKDRLKSLLKQDNNAENPMLKFLFEFVFKPTKLVISAIEYAKGNPSILNHMLGSNKAPFQGAAKYLVMGGPIIFVFLFFILYALWSKKHTIFSNMVERLFKQKYPKWLVYTFGMIMAVFGAYGLFKDATKSENTFTDKVGRPSIAKALMFLVKWFFKLIVNMSLVGMSVSIAWAYTLYYLFLGIWTKNDEPAKEMDRMNQKMYSFIRSPANTGNESMDYFIGSLKTFIGVVFTYVFEAFALYKLMGNTSRVFTNRIRNQNLRAFLHSIVLLLTILILLFCVIVKPFTNVWFKDAVLPLLTKLYSFF